MNGDPDDDSGCSLSPDSTGTGLCAGRERRVISHEKPLSVPNRGSFRIYRLRCSGTLPPTLNHPHIYKYTHTCLLVPSISPTRLGDGVFTAGTKKETRTGPVQRAAYQRGFLPVSSRRRDLYRTSIRRIIQHSHSSYIQLSGFQREKVHRPLDFPFTRRESSSSPVLVIP